MSKPLVAIVGRPNVGKSTLFNRIIGQRLAIVEDTPGVTRDRLYADAEWLTHSFTLIDTGGIDPDSADILLANMRKQAGIAIDMADVILFLTDAREGLTSGDEDVADMLRRSGKPVLLVVNKVDQFPAETLIYDFFSLGIGQPIPVSAGQALGLGDMLDELVALFPPDTDNQEDTQTIKVAMAGRPNVGKSSLVNTILREERVIVSDIPGTTRDAIDTPFSCADGQFIIIDTAGMRKRGRIEDESLERYSVVRALGAIRRCDVALLMIDALQGVTEQDAHIAGFIQEQGKAAVIVVNKWDLVEKGTGTLEHMQRKILDALRFMDYAPVMFVSAKTGQRVTRLLPTVKDVFATSCSRVSTGVLNDVISDAMLINEPPIHHGRRVKILYATQASVRPPTYILFVNDPDAMLDSYLRYLENYLRKSVDLSGTPVRFILRQRNS